MSSPIGDKRAVKIFVLYLLENIGYPLELCTLSDIVMKSDYVMFLDFAESFNEMLDSGLIEPLGEDPVMYMITERGRVVAQGLKSDVLPSILDKSLAAALRYLDFARRGVTCDCDIIELDKNTGACKIRIIISEKRREILNLTLAVDSMDRAVRMKSNFESRPEVVFRGVNALLSGNVNYLFGD
ncbi:MAG: DUF4364 family protein [Clostridia bacterium]|nr:DUF4364 family protein [Clostridia bacterium]